MNVPVCSPLMSATLKGAVKAPLNLFPYCLSLRTQAAHRFSRHAHVKVQRTLVMCGACTGTRGFPSPLGSLPRCKAFTTLPPISPQYTYEPSTVLATISCHIDSEISLLHLQVCPDTCQGAVHPSIFHRLCILG